MELPAQGYPTSRQAIIDWFRRTHGREPTEQEVGAIQLGMIGRETTEPDKGPTPDPGGWSPISPQTSPPKG